MPVQPSQQTLKLEAPVADAEALDGKPATQVSGASVRELVLSALRAAGTAGTKAPPIRESIEKLRGARLHDKTVGMTLYRLSQDGLARRVGRTWFFVAETKNPGVAAPGSETP